MPDKDLSYIYMLKQDGYCQIDMRGGEKITDPVYCLECELRKVHVTNDTMMNPIQAYEHVIIHTERGHMYDRGGLQRLSSNADRFNRLMVRRAQKLKESSEHARLQKILANG